MIRNTFHPYRDYEKESERKAIAEEFYRIQHINQTYAFEVVITARFFPETNVLKEFRSTPIFLFFLEF